MDIHYQDQGYQIIQDDSLTCQDVCQYFGEDSIAGVEDDAAQQVGVRRRGVIAAGLSIQSRNFLFIQMVFLLYNTNTWCIEYMFICYLVNF